MRLRRNGDTVLAAELRWRLTFTCASQQPSHAHASHISLHRDLRGVRCVSHRRRPTSSRSGRLLSAGLCGRRRQRRRPVRHAPIRVHGQHAWLEEAARLPAVSSLPSRVPAPRHRRDGRVGQSRLPEPRRPIPPPTRAHSDRLARTRMDRYGRAGSLGAAHAHARVL